ncbi:MAG: RraA family protein, partial [Geminicoccaceae bacterium]
LPVYCRGITPNSCVRSGPGTVGLPVVAGGVHIATGDLVVGDADGVVIVPRARLGEIASRLDAIRTAELAAEERVRGGQTIMGDIEALLASNRVRRLG